jgi:MFS family permease
VPRARRGLTFREALAALRQISSNRTILSMVALAGVSSLLIGNGYTPQMPAFAADLGAGEVGFAYSALLAANAAGAVIGGLILEGGNLLRPRARTAFIAASIWCLALGGFALSGSYPLSLGLLFVAGISQLTFMSMGQTLVQLLAPADLRGRAIGLFQMAQSGLRAFSGISIGLFGAVAIFSLVLLLRKPVQPVPV